VFLVSKLDGNPLSLTLSHKGRGNKRVSHKYVSYPNHHDSTSFDFAAFGTSGQAGQTAHHKWFDFAHHKWGEGTTTSPINMRGIRITIEAVAFLGKRL
jgi:hypothetical protein